jgi:hypothetical protein
VCVIPHWIVQGDAQGRWSVTMYLNVDTSLAERRMETPDVVGVRQGGEKTARSRGDTEKSAEAAAVSNSFRK